MTINRTAIHHPVIEFTPQAPQPTKRNPSIDWLRVPATMQHYAIPVLRQLGYAERCAPLDKYAHCQREIECRNGRNHYRNII